MYNVSNGSDLTPFFFGGGIYVMQCWPGLVCQEYYAKPKVSIHYWIWSKRGTCNALDQCCSDFVGHGFCVTCNASTRSQSKGENVMHCLIAGMSGALFNVQC